MHQAAAQARQQLLTAAGRLLPALSRRRWQRPTHSRRQLQVDLQQQMQQ